MLRIIGGCLKGRKLLDSSKLKDVRPTTDRNREAIFNIICSGKYTDFFDIDGSVVLDICAGTGAFAIESISRGAKKAICVEKNPKHIDLIKSNLNKLDISEKCQLILADGKRLDAVKDLVSLVFIDPPYRADADVFLQAIIKSGILQEKCLIIVESDAQLKTSHEKLLLLDSKKYGISYFSFFRLN